MPSIEHSATALYSTGKYAVPTVPFTGSRFQTFTAAVAAIFLFPLILLQEMADTVVFSL